uniref:Uncharacterized protein n=1 Tax=Rhizophora mucronata TaxID=61149 RepID=A0A2P2NSM0_RHIMU
MISLCTIFKSPWKVSSST